MNRDELIESIQNFNWMQRAIAEYEKNCDPCDYNAIIYNKRVQLIERYKQTVDDVLKRLDKITTDDRQMQILLELLQGASLRQLGKKMNISRTTIMNERNKIIDAMLRD